MREITYISPLQSAIVISIVSVIVVTVSSFALSVLPALINGRGAIQNLLPYWLMTSLIAGATTFGSTFVGCVVYNFIARKFGGIKMMLS